MEIFPYPIRYFTCRQYDEQQKIEMEKLDNNFFDGLQAYVGAVAGETGIDGLKLDFRCGMRLQIPVGKWHIRISHQETGEVFLEEDLQEIILVSQEKYYIPWKIEVFAVEEKVFEHVFDPTGQHVHIVMVSQAVGDTIAFMLGVKAFRKKYKAELSMFVTDKMRNFVREWYPDVPHREQLPDETYAVFWVGGALTNKQWIPVHGKLIPLQAFSQYVLGLDKMPERVSWQPRQPRQIKEPYVCIGVQASSPVKSWLWPHGWDEIVAYLKDKGYRVLCIDKSKAMAMEAHNLTIRMPAGAEDFTGNYSLAERADMLAYADFFIGLGSGLSWLAWIAGCPVIMIAGFSAVWYEFPEAYRVFNPMACHGCFNDLQDDYMKEPCRRYAHDKQHYLECQRKISPIMVKRVIDRCCRDIQRGNN